MNNGLVPRTQRSVPSTVRCRAGACVAANRVACRVPALRSNAKSVAARQGHESGVPLLQAMLMPLRLQAAASSGGPLSLCPFCGLEWALAAMRPA